ncbi:hypothetical protein C9374_008504 [Naegleria lovaniensis]|uniref:Transmembrane protein n=1 Tax=Naegleria lovaniensis TaxID=51637 RepID=A0AA88GJK0_NAELO|nr:uncharacterized protein C9374_008504 [Naegleria lovaniensis]KAG2378361.1 hypothetical protein C9374_008504 [Naegleria lovaniensis]
MTSKRIIEIPSTFGKTENVTSSKAFRYNTFEDTTLAIAVNFNANVTPIQVMAESLPVSLYNFYLVIGNHPPSFTLLGVYRLTIRNVNVSDVQNDITLDITLRSPFGIFNVNPSTVGFYKLNSYYFSPTNSRAFYNYANFNTTVLSFCRNTRVTSCDIIFGVFGVEKDYTTASFGALQTVYGPSSFRYVVGISYIYTQTLTLSFKGQFPYSEPPTFNLTTYTPNSTAELPLNYYMLKAFNYETSHPEPAVFQQTWDYYFGLSLYFTDYSGKEVIVDVSKLECACKSSTSRVFSIYYGAIVNTLNGKITCSGRGTKSCRQLAIVAPQPNVNTLYEGVSYMATLRRGSSNYYKFSVQPYEVVYIEIYAISGNGFLKLRKDHIPTSSNYDLERVITYASSSQQIVGSVNYPPTMYYIAISNEYSSSMEYVLKIRTTNYQDVWSKKLSPLMFFSIMSIFFCVLAGLIISVVIRRNRRPPPKEYHVPDIQLDTFSMTPPSSSSTSNTTQYYEPHHTIQPNGGGTNNNNNGFIPLRNV